MFALFMRFFDDYKYVYETLLAISILFKSELSLMFSLIFILYQWFEIKNVIAFFYLFVMHFDMFHVMKFI